MKTILFSLIVLTSCVHQANPFGDAKTDTSIYYNQGFKQGYDSAVRQQSRILNGLVKKDSGYVFYKKGRAWDSQNNTWIEGIKWSIVK